MAIRNIFDREKRERRRQQAVRFVAWMSFLTLLILALDRALQATILLSPS